MSKDERKIFVNPLRATPNKDYATFGPNDSDLLRDDRDQGNEKWFHFNLI